MMYCYEFTVEGRTEFPLDMLRYNGCYPKTQEDVSKMTSDRSEGPRSVTLVAWHEGRGWVAKWDRWESFGWRLTNMGPAIK